jgi:subtilisin family serine protease
LDGSGIGVAVIDSGIHSTADFQRLVDNSLTVNQDQAQLQADQQYLGQANTTLQNAQNALVNCQKNVQSDQANVQNDQQQAQHDYQQAQQDLQNNNLGAYNNDIAHYNQDIAKLNADTTQFNADNALIPQLTTQVNTAQAQYNALNAQVSADQIALNVAKSGNRIAYQQSFIGDTDDHYGHGTHVAGIIAGNGKQSLGSNFTKTFTGIAPNAYLINLKALDQNGAGTDSTVINAIQTAINLKSQYNIRVINLSLGRAVYESYTLDPLCQAVEQAWKAGIVVVVAAGNDGRDNSANTNGYGTITAPGNDPYVITVGAMKPMDTSTRTDDLIASYSSKGPTLYDHIVKPDLVAPGNRAISVLAGGSVPEYSQTVNFVSHSFYIVNGDKNASSNYFQLSGTSMAAAVVSGGVADLLEAQPQLTPDQVKARLMQTAYKTFPSYSSTTDATTGITYTSQYDIFTIGAGYLDLQAALASTDVATGSALSPAVTYD